MVSLRSGKRTARPSLGNSSEPQQEGNSNRTETPRRRGRVAKETQQVFEEPTDADVPAVPEIPLEQDSPSKTTPVSEEVLPEFEEDQNDIAEPEESRDVATPNPELALEIEEPKSVSKDVFASSGDEYDEERAVTSDDEDDFLASPKMREHVTSDEDEIVPDSEDDEPIEVTSKMQTLNKNPMEVTSETEPLDEEPMEVTSKMDTSVEEPKSVVDKFLERKAERSAKLAAKKMKKRNKKKESKKIAEGVFEVKMKKSKAKFNVVTLKSGVQRMLEPEINFREELLKARTSGARFANTEKSMQRSKWVSKR